MKHSETIEKEVSSLQERGIPDGSYFHVFFDDGSEITEHDCNWSSISEEVGVKWADKTKVAMVCTKPVKKLVVYHNGMSTSVEPQNGEKVYQAIKSYATITSEFEVSGKIIGRVVGLVKDGVVLEEQFIDERSNSIQGIRF